MHERRPAPRTASPSASARWSPTTTSRSSCARGEVMALLGENGAGKTTLMNILFGHYVADEGSIEAFGKPLPPGDPRGAGGRHRHGAPAFHPGRQPDGAGQHHAGHRAAVAAPVASRRGARASCRRWRERFGLTVDPDARGRQAVGGRAPAGRNPEGALPRRPHPDPGRADRRADAAGERGAVRHAAAAGGAKACRIIFITHKLDEVMACQRPRRRAARRQAGGRARGRRRRTAASWRS